MRETIVVYADGGCTLKDGFGGAAYAFRIPGGLVTGYGGYESTTNQQMELVAATEGLKAALTYTEENPDTQYSVILISDSQYVVKGMNEWIYGWIANGWRNANRKPVSNQDLWRSLHDVAQKFADLEFKWVRGHSGVQMNEFVDQQATLAQSEARGGVCQWTRKRL